MCKVCLLPKSHWEIVTSLSDKPSQNNHWWNVKLKSTGEWKLPLTCHKCVCDIWKNNKSRATPLMIDFTKPFFYHFPSTRQKKPWLLKVSCLYLTLFPQLVCQFHCEILQDLFLQESTSFLRSKLLIMLSVNEKPELKAGMAVQEPRVGVTKLSTVAFSAVGSAQMKGGQRKRKNRRHVC